MPTVVVQATQARTPRGQGARRTGKPHYGAALTATQKTQAPNLDAALARSRRDTGQAPKDVWEGARGSAHIMMGQRKGLGKRDGGLGRIEGPGAWPH